MNKHNFPSENEHCYMATLSTKLTGPELRRKLSIGGKIPDGTFCSTLWRLANNGWITCKPAPGLDRRVRIYKITAHGKNVLIVSRARYRRLAIFPISEIL
jgi:DNA-binding PadR family transcriptional regulator